MFGSPKAFDSVFSLMAYCCDCLVVSPQYRRAPEHPYPVPLNDCHEGLSHIVDCSRSGKSSLEQDIFTRVDEERVVIGGFSAGGNLAAALCLRLAETKEINVAMQVLDCPCLDAACKGSSYEECGNMFFNLTKDQMLLFWKLYLEGDKETIAAEDSLCGSSANSEKDFLLVTQAVETSDVFASPMLATDEQLASLPKTVLFVAELDPLRDDGVRYGERLERAGVEVELKRQSGVEHCFGLNFYFSSSRQLHSKMCSEIRKTLYGPDIERGHDVPSEWGKVAEMVGAKLSLLAKAMKPASEVA